VANYEAGKFPSKCAVHSGNGMITKLKVSFTEWLHTCTSINPRDN